MPPTVRPTKAIAVKILELLDHGLTKGLGDPEPGKMCVEAAVCYAMGIEHSDEPPCVARSVRAFKIVLNDSAWSSNTARAKGLKRLAIAQLGSDEIDETIFVKELALSIVRQVLPIALRASELPTNAFECESVKDLSAAWSVRSAAESDRVLRIAAEAAVQALIVAKSPGCKWLHLTENE